MCYLGNLLRFLFTGCGPCPLFGKPYLSLLRFLLQLVAIGLGTPRPLHRVVQGALRRSIPVVGMKRSRALGALHVSGKLGKSAIQPRAFAVVDR